MKLSETTPFVRYARVQSDFDIYKNTLYPRDNRCFYCLGGSGEIEICGCMYRVEKDTVLLWRGGMSYRYHPDESTPFSFAAVNFDFTSDGKRTSSPLYPLEKSLFSSESLTENVKIEDVPAFDEVMIQKNAVHLRDAFETIVREYRERRVFCGMKCSALFAGILAELARYSFADAGGTSAGVIEEILTYIQNHCAENLSNSVLGKKFGYHPNYISALISGQTGMPLHRYFLMCRVRRAAELLRETTLSSAEIAEKCGFSSAAYFSRYFKFFSGVSPTEFRKCGK